MKFDENQLKQLLEWYMGLNETQEVVKKRWEDNAQWRSWIDLQKIDGISDEELRNLFIDYFNRGAGRHFFNAIYRDRIILDAQKFRNTLKFLLNESTPLKERLNGVLYRDGVFHIEGIGKGLTTSFLMDLNPHKYATWNNKINMGLEQLGLMPDFNRGDDWGDKYQKVLRTLEGLKNLRPELSYLEIDYFLHTISAEERGIEAVNSMMQKGSIPVPKPPEKLVAETEGMEFVMETYLEEFIAANFDKIDFGGKKLQLYQDEEASGKQYSTDIGSIDLLAIDEQNKQFVVIELKKGKSSDTVIGQVLRYMGWVNENLIIDPYADYTVRGMIISKEKDEKLEYALKLLSMVDAYNYSISFSLKKG